MRYPQSSTPCSECLITGRGPFCFIAGSDLGTCTGHTGWLGYSCSTSMLPQVVIDLNVSRFLNGNVSCRITIHSSGKNKNSSGEWKNCYGFKLDKYLAYWSRKKWLILISCPLICASLKATNHSHKGCTILEKLDIAFAQHVTIPFVKNSINWSKLCNTVSSRDVC